MVKSGESSLGWARGFENFSKSYDVIVTQIQNRLRDPLCNSATYPHHLRVCEARATTDDVLGDTATTRTAALRHSVIICDRRLQVAFSFPLPCLFVRS